MEIQHSFCPDGPDTWCKYKLDVVNGSDVYLRKCLPPVFRDELLPIFRRLSSPELLKSCAKGLTQNQNESLNNVVWSKCSKRVFIGLHRFILAVSEAVTSFNDGAKSREDLLVKLNLECGVSAKKVLSIQNKLRLQNAKIKSTEKCRKRRQALRQLRKGKKITDASYIAGGFSKSVVPDTLPVDFFIDTPMEVDVTFIDEKDVQIITLRK